jgi:hypothetical protein
MAAPSHTSQMGGPWQSADVQYTYQPGGSLRCARRDRPNTPSCAFQRRRAPELGANLGTTHFGEKNLTDRDGQNR